MEPNFEKVRIVVGEPDSRLRTGFKYALQSGGFKETNLTNDFGEIEKVLALNLADLLLLDINMQDGDVCDLVRRVRNQELGENPFTVIVAMGENLSADQISSILSAGFDDVVLKPLSVEILNKRFGRLALNRKPFVVTKDYIGPDRRGSKRDGEAGTPLIDVPNPFKAKVTGEISAKSIKESIKSMSSNLRAIKIERLAFQVNWLSERIMPGFMDDVLVPETIGWLEELSNICDEAVRIISTTPYVAEEIMFETIKTLAEKIRSHNEKPIQAEFEEMFKLSKMIEKNILKQENAA